MNFCLPKSLLFYHIQLSHAVEAQWLAVEWQQSPTPVFNMMARNCAKKGIYRYF